ncbi:reduction of Rh1 isoform X2 [Andrena cerasifolii]
MSATENPGRPMKYPYTLSAKIAQFPYAYYYKHSWVFKYWVLGCLVTAPIFYKIQKMSYSPENVEKWRAIDKETFSGKSHH